MDDAVALQAKLSDVEGRAIRLLEDCRSHDGPLSEELSDRMESAISELGTLSSEFATGQNPNLFTASRLTVLAAGFLGGLGRSEEGIMNLLEMERLCHESNRRCFNGMLECAWMRAKLLLRRGDSETEAAKAALLHCLALGEENKQKFEEGTLEDVDSLIKRVKYSLGKLYLSTSEGDASDPIPLLMVAEEEDDEYFDKADTHYLLGSAHLNVHRISGSVQDLKVGIDYLKSSFTISRAKNDTGTVFSRSNKVGKFLFKSREFGHSLEMFKEAAAFAKTVGSQNWEMEFWLNCGRVLLEEEKYEEAVEHFTASLEVALQLTDEQKEKHIEIAYKMLYGTQLLLSGSLTKDEFYKDTVTTSQFIESEVKAGERHALAMFSIGVGKFLQGQEAEGCHYLQDTLDFVNTLQVQGQPDSNLHMLIYQIQMSLAGMYRHSTNLEAAANLYKTCAAMVDKPSTKLKCIYNEVEALIASFHYVEAMEVVNTALEWSYALVDTEWTGVASLLFLLGVVLYLCGSIEEAISKLLEACKYWEEKRAFEDEGLAYAYICLFQAYLVNQEYRQAFEFAKHIQGVLEQYHSEDDILVRWKALNGTGYMLLGDQVAGVKYLTLALDEAKHKGDWQLQLAILGNLARAYKNQKKFTSALAKYEEMEELCSEPGGTAGVQLRAQMSINRGDIYLQLAQQNTDWQCNCQLGLQEYKKATEILACQPFTEHLQAMAYAGQAVLLRNLEKEPEAQEMVRKALKLAGQDRLLIARLKYIQAHAKVAVADAIVITREAALLFAAVQMELQDLEVAWVTLFGSEMKHMFIMLQRLYVDAEEYTKAFLWAERGRMRLFQHKIEGNQVSHLLELAERGKGTNNSAIHRSRMVVDNGARKVLPELESVFTDLDHMHLNQPGSGGTAEGADIPMPDTCDLGASENNFMEEIISGGLENDLKHMKVGFGQNLEDIVGQSSASEAIAMESLESNQHMQQEYRSTWEGEAGPGTMSAGVSSADPLWFDKNDSLAEKLIFQTLGECGQGTAVVEYMYADDENLLFAYILKPGVDPLIHCHRTILKAFFQGEERTKMGTTLLALVTNTRTAIMKHQKRALLGLQILAELLVAPVRDHIWDCSNIIFAPHEILHSVPFCALHNKETFLIQEKTISLIPSVRALHQCFIQQQAFEVACRNETVGPAFVAGNPEPMGLGLDQLKGAAEEAEEVAELLNVEAILGGRVTKEAVIQGLSSACLVVLGTHGIVDPAHPHGALVLQGCKPLLSVSQKAASELNGDGSSSLRSARRRLFGRGSLEKAVATASETLTPEEITALPGGVHTGLVVLSACQTGKGEVTSEGVFSLWRALLQAGAPAVIVSLWKVDDGSTKALIKDLFTGLVKDGKPLAEALQSAMVHMLNDGHHNVFHWAPFVVVGSPFLKIPNFSCMAKLSSIQVKDE